MEGVSDAPQSGINSGKIFKKMVQPPAKIDSQLVYLDPFLMDRARLNSGMSRKQVAQKTLAINTVLGAFNGNGLQPEKARVLAKRLGHKVVDLLAPWDPRYVAPSESSATWRQTTEWEIADYLEQGRLASNGLYYIVCKMCHRHTTAKLGRGKFYHLSWLSPDARKAMATKLSRHAEVCSRVGIHPQVVVNLTSTPVANDEGWWVVDHWAGEKTLADYLQTGPWPEDRLPRLLLDVALGLDALHRAEVVFRELAPARVLIADNGGRAVLTDFELAKLLDGSPSVSSEWPEDPFRAPEVDGGNATLRADLYSLGCLAAAALAGGVRQAGEAATILQQSGLPKRVYSLLARCVEPVPDRRPPELAPILKVLTRWAEK